MTDAQILAAARILCEKRGLDPDERVAHGAKPDRSGYTPDICLYSPRYLLVVDEIRAFDELRNACDAALMEDAK